MHCYHGYSVCVCLLCHQEKDRTLEHKHDLIAKFEEQSKQMTATINAMEERWGQIICIKVGK